MLGAAWQVGIGRESAEPRLPRNTEAVFFLCLLDLALAGFSLVLLAVSWPAPPIFGLHGRGRLEKDHTQPAVPVCLVARGWSSESRDKQVEGGLRVAHALQTGLRSPQW